MQIAMYALQNEAKQYYHRCDCVTDPKAWGPLEGAELFEDEELCRDDPSKTGMREFIRENGIPCHWVTVFLTYDVTSYDRPLTVFNDPAKAGPLTETDLEYILFHTCYLEKYTQEQFDGFMPGGDSECAYTTIDMLRRLVADLKAARGESSNEGA